MTEAEWAATLLSLRVASMAVAMNLPFAVGAAFVLARKTFPGKALFDGLVHAPLVLPPILVGYLLLVILGTKGAVGAWLYDTFGIQLAFTTFGASIAAAVMSFPLMVRAIRLTLEAIDPGLEQAARTLGASPLDRFFSITLPLMLPGIVAGVVLAFAASLGEFGATITFAANIAGETRTLPLAIYTAIQTPGGDQLAFRLAVVAFVLAVVALLASEFLARRMTKMIGQESSRRADA